MKNFIILCFLFSGCALFHGLQPQCEQADSAELGRTYAYKGSDIKNFEIFAHQCAKYNYQVPSQEKFKASYDSSMKDMCSTVRNYFKAAYDTYRTEGYPHACDDYVKNVEAYKQVNHDAFDASLYKKQIILSDSKIRDYDKEKSNNILTNLFSGPGPYYWEAQRNDAIEKLKVITKKYNVYISEL